MGLVQKYISSRVTAIVRLFAPYCAVFKMTAVCLACHLSRCEMFHQ